MGVEANHYLRLMLGMEISAVPFASNFHISKEIPTSYSSWCGLAYAPSCAFSRGASSSIQIMRSKTIFLSEEGENEES